MNIYINVEVSFRELDSKILLAVLAASRGHEVLVSNGTGLTEPLKSKILNPGIYHTKSITPSNTKIKRHQELIYRGHKITSIDEESSLYAESEEVEQFIIDRSSDKSVEQSTAVFSWGAEEKKIFNKLYPKNKHKFHQTGSPRVDLWKPAFQNYWKKSKSIPKKPFLLVSSNMIATDNIQFHENVKYLGESGYFNRNPKLFKNFFYAVSEDYKKIYEFIAAVEHLAKNNNGYQIVFRPHPAENIEMWKIFLKDIPNLYIIREESITAWVKYAFAVMHNGCTTGLETTISGKPLLTFTPFEMEFDNKLFNTLGYKLNSKEELLSKANELFISHQKDNIQKIKTEIPEYISKKLFIDDNELAAEKIIKVWESFSSNSLCKSNNWIKYYLSMKASYIKNYLINKMKGLVSIRINEGLVKENIKFPPLDEKDIKEKVARLQSLLGIKKLECKFFSKKSFLIRKY